MDVVDEWTSMYAPVPGSYHGMSGTWFFDAASETGTLFQCCRRLVHWVQVQTWASEPIPVRKELGMNQDLEVPMGLISQFLGGHIGANELHRGLEDWLASEPGYLGSKGDVIGEIVALLHLEPANDQTEAAALRNRIAIQASKLRALPDHPILRASTPRAVAEFLEDDDPGVRAWAAGLAPSVGPSAVLDDKIRAALHDVDGAVARMAALAAAKRGDLRALPDLVQLLHLDLTRPYRLEIWAAAELAKTASDAEREAVVEALSSYIERGSAASSQASSAITTLERNG